MKAVYDRKAEVGIGTSILFVAMITISGVASSMIIDNTTLVTEQAEDVVAGSLDTTVNFLDVKSVVGVCDPDREVVLGLEMVVVLGAGSADLNLSSLIIELLLPGDHVLLTCGGDGFISERKISGGLTNSTTILGKGDIFLLRFDLPSPVHHGQEIKVALMPVHGFVNFLCLDIPDTLTARYVSLR